MTNAIVTARLRHAVVDVDLASRPGEPNRARTFKAVYQIQTGTAIHARIRFAFIDVNFALSSRESCKRREDGKTKMKLNVEKFTKCLSFRLNAPSTGTFRLRSNRVISLRKTVSTDR